MKLSCDFLKIYIISDSFIFPLVKGLSLKKIKPIFLRGTPAQFFFEKEGKWPILRIILEKNMKFDFPRGNPCPNFQFFPNTWENIANVGSQS